MALLSQLQAGTVDLIYGLLRRPDWATDVAEEHLFEDSFCIVVRHDHPLTRIDQVTTEHLAAYEWVVPAPGASPRRQVIEALFADMSPPMNFGVETSSVATIRALVTSSNRVSVLTRHEATFDERNRLLAVLPMKLGGTSRKGITTRVGWLPTQSQQMLMDLLRFHTSAGTRNQSPGGTAALPRLVSRQARGG